MPVSFPCSSTTMTAPTLALCISCAASLTLVFAGARTTVFCSIRSRIWRCMMLSCQVAWRGTGSVAYDCRGTDAMLILVFVPPQLSAGCCNAKMRLLAYLQERPMTARVADREKIEGDSRRKIHRVDGERLEEKVGTEDMLQQHRPHALEDVARRNAVRDRLQPCGQHSDRIVDAGHRRDQEHCRPRQLLGSEPPAQHQPGYGETDRPPADDEVHEKSDQRKSQRKNRIVKEQPGEDARPPDADQGAHHAHGELAGDQLPGAQRAHEEIAEIARVHLLEEGQRDAELPAKKDVPEQDRPDEKPWGVGEEVARRSQIHSDEAPHDHSHRGVVRHGHEARPRLEHEISVTLDQRHDSVDRPRAACDCAGHDTMPSAWPSALAP